MNDVSSAFNDLQFLQNFRVIFVRYSVKTVILIKNRLIDYLTFSERSARVRAWPGEMKANRPGR